ncbi:MAG: MBL fold metallo-hydrolase [Rectinemataceae bacterium]
MNVKILGTGGFENEGLPFNSFLIDGRILVETPPDILQSLRREAVPLGAIRTVVLTHFHGDHCFGLPFLLFNIAKASGQTPAERLTIAGPAGLRDRIEQLLALAISPESPYIHWFRRNVDTVEIDETSNLDLGGGLWMRFMPTEHPVPTFGILVGDGRSATPMFAATSDTKWGRKAAAFFASGARLILCDVNGGPGNGVHMGPAEAAEKALPLVSPGTRVFGTHVSTDRHKNHPGLGIAKAGDSFEV